MGKTPVIFGILRVRNESRWIRDVLRRILPICERIFVLDDHSDDGTAEVCEEFERATVIRSKFDGLDESRDREYLLQRVMGNVSDIHLTGDVNSNFWALAIDGDELLELESPSVLTEILRSTPHHAFRLDIKYLWNSDLSRLKEPGQRRVRVDGVYNSFSRPSLFRLMNSAFRYQRTPFGGNFHCSSIPQELLHQAHLQLPGALLWHLGYNDREDRVRKFAWYNLKDPNNRIEDGYRHMVQGDLDEFPATAQFRHAGPLALQLM